MNKTAYIYDDIYLEHDTGGNHPECPERLIAINKHLKESSFYNDLIMLKPSPAGLPSVELIHSPSYIRQVQQSIQRGAPYLDSGDTVVGPRSFDAALMAVGGCLRACDALMTGEADNAFCAVRPPGHHAEREYAGGFCIFNNIAIAVRYLQNIYGLGRVAVVDWDVHHGNGTQHAFEKDDSVYYIRLHQYPHYPGSGAPQERGRDRGTGFTMNIPMASGSADKDYFDAFTNDIIPALENYEPECICISAGFDAHRADPLSGIRLSTDAYQVFTEKLMDLARRFCKKRIIIALEGGYHLEALANSVTRVVKTLVTYEGNS